MDTTPDPRAVNLRAPRAARALRVALLALAACSAAAGATACRSPEERAAIRAERDRRRAMRQQERLQEMEARRAMQAAEAARIAEQNRAREAEQAAQEQAARAQREAQLEQQAQQCRARNYAACIDAAVAYRDGAGVAVNDQRAVELYNIACNARDMRGCVGLGWMAEQGRGMPQNFATAVRWYDRACTARNGLGCNNLAALYQAGRGVPQDMGRAQALFQAACTHGHAAACARVQGAAQVNSVAVVQAPAQPAAVVVVQPQVAGGACASGFWNSEGHCCPHSFTWQGAMNCCARFQGNWACWNPNPQPAPIVQTQPAMPVAQASVLLIGGSRSNFGSMTLRPNFLPDPITTSVISGGNIDARSLNLDGQTCHGYVSRAPDYILRLTGPTPFLRFYVRGAQGSDATLIVNDGAGRWHCDDDGGGNLNPMVDIQGAPAGQYDIWVGSYRAGENASSVLHITEMPSNRP